MAKPTIIVIGAGVAGLTSALELADRGLGVEVVERGRVLGEGSCSWMAGGMLAPWCERATTEPEVADWGAPSIDWWAERFPETVRKGSLVVAQPRDLPDLTRFAQRTERFDWLDADGIAELEPDLGGRFRRALFFADEAHLDPRRALAALARRLQRPGRRDPLRRRDGAAATRRPTSSSIAAALPRATPCRTCAACAARWWWCARPTCRCSGRCACCIRASRSTSCRAAMACS